MKTRQNIIPAIAEWSKRNERWCPLFGELLFYESCSVMRMEKGTLDHCIHSISELRKVWGVNEELKKTERLSWKYNSWPEIEQIRYPSKKLNSARIIFQGFGKMEDDVPFMPADSPTRVKSAFDEIMKRVLESARKPADDSVRSKPYRNVRDSQILALFGIWVSWRTFKALVDQERTSRDPWFKTQIDIAEFLTEYCYRREREEKEGQIEKLKPEARKYKEHLHRRMKGLRGCAEENIRKRKGRQEKVQACARQITEEKGQLSQKELYHEVKKQIELSWSSFRRYMGWKK